MKYTKKAAVKAAYNIISSVAEAHENIKEIAYDHDEKYWYMNEYMIVRLGEYHDAGYRLVPFDSSHIKPFARFLEHARKNVVDEELDPPEYETLKAVPAPQLRYEYKPGFFVNKKWLINAWNLLGPEMKLKAPENPVWPLYVYSDKGEACIYPMRPEVKTYERDFK